MVLKGRVCLGYLLNFIERYPVIVGGVHWLKCYGLAVVHFLR